MRKDLLPKRPLSTTEEDVPNILNVMVLYDSMAAGLRAMRLFTRLVHQHGASSEFRPLIWCFDQVDDPDWRDFLNEDAFHADLFIISATGQPGLPNALTNWLLSSLSAKQGSDVVLVALLGEAGNLDARSSPRLQFLRRLAVRFGLAFFAPGTEEMGPCAPRVRIFPEWFTKTEVGAGKISIRPEKRAGSQENKSSPRV